MSDWPKWVDGETYTYAEISPYTFPAEGRRRQSPPPGALFVRSTLPSGLGVFDEVVANPNPLVSGMQSQLAVENMLVHGLSFREIARQAGVSIESVFRANSGVGNVRLSTETALLQVSGALNGKPRR